MPATETLSALANPFPGLRTFEAEESHLFFGREQQSDELLQRLGRQRFVAVVGVSGSGKSSLVRAGLLPALHGGFLVNSRTWRQVCLRPGDRPIERLAEGLAELPSFAPADLDEHMRAKWIETSLRRSGRGLVEATRLAHLSPDESLLVVVDQFEELFRYKPDEAGAFVRLLLEAVHQDDLPIYVVITMRSDYLGDCARFRDLPETLNDAQYLVPRMTRDQRRLAIEGPVLVGGGVMSPALLNRLLNDVGEDPDRLPVLQHALMRTWDHWANDPARRPEIDLEDYRAIGEMSGALSRHADGAFASLQGERLKRIAESAFRRLTERDADHREIRRPTTVGELMAVADATLPEIETVLDAFLMKGRSFLIRSPSEGPLAPDVTIDISHESLIRSWSKLRTWAEAEAAAGEHYRRLADAAARHAKGTGSLLVNPDLDQALAWRTSVRPNAVWAERYGGNFDQTVRFLEASRSADRKRTLSRRLLIGLGVALCIVLVQFITEINEGQNTRRALASQYLTDAFATTDRGDFVRAAHLFGLAAEQASDDAVRDVALLNVWKYAGAIAATFPDVRDSDGRPLRINHAVRSPASGTLTWSDEGALALWRDDDGNVKTAIGKHAGVQGATFAPDGDRVATWSADGKVLVWNTNQLSGPGAFTHDKVVAASFIDGRRLLTWGADGMARVWHLDAGNQPARALNHGAPVTNAVFNDDGRWVMTWSDPLSKKIERDAMAGDYGTNQGPGAQEIRQLQHAMLWDLQNPSAPAQTCGTNPVKVIPSTGRALSINLDGTASFCDVQSRTSATLSHGTGRPIMDARFDPFDPSGNTVMTWSTDREVKVWSIAGRTAGETRSSLIHTSPVAGANFSSDGRIFTWDQDAVRVWPQRTIATAKDPALAFGQETGALHAVRFSRGGKAVTWRQDGTARLWDVANGRLVRELPSNAPVLDGEFSSDGHSLLLWDKSGRVRTFDADSGSLELDGVLSEIAGATLLSDHAVLAWDQNGAARLIFATPSEYSSVGHTIDRIVPDATGRRVLAVAGDEIARMTSDNQQPSGNFIRPHPDSPLGGVEITRSGEVFLTWPRAGDQASDPLPQLWNWVGGRTATLAVRAPVLGAELSADGRFVVTWDGIETRLWNAADGSPLGAFAADPPMGSGATISEDGNLALVWSGTDAALWRTTPLQLQKRFTLDGPIAGAVFSPGARRVAVWIASHRTPAVGKSAPGCSVFPIDSDARTDICNGDIVSGALFTSDQSLLTWTDEGSTRIWDIDRRSATRLRQDTPVRGATLSPFDGGTPRVVTWNDDGTWRLWNSRDGSQITQVVRQSRGIVGAQFDASGRALRTWDASGTVRVWPLDADLDFPRQSIPQLVRALTGSRLDNQQNVATLATDEWASERAALRRVLDDHLDGRCANPGAIQAMRGHIRITPGPPQ